MKELKNRLDPAFFPVNEAASLEVAKQVAEEQEKAKSFTEDDRNLLHRAIQLAEFNLAAANQYNE